MLPILVPVYRTASDMYVCGETPSSISYMLGNEGAEWCVVVVASMFAVLGTFASVWLHFHAKHIYSISASSRLVLEAIDLAADTDDSPLQPTSRVFTWQLALLSLVWMLAVLVFSVPSIMYAVAKSIPGGGQNIWGVPASVLDVFVYGIGPIIFFITLVVVPTSARKTIALIIGTEEHPHMATAMILTGRLFVVLAVPMLVLMLLGTDCMSKWLWFWAPCQDVSNFNVTMLSGQNAIKILSYEDICITSAMSDYASAGRCSRFVIAGLGELAVSKLVFTAFVAPGVSLFLSFPRVSAMMESVIRIVHPEYRSSKSLDVELAGLVMLMELALVFGVLVPLVAPLVAIALATQLATFHLAREQFGLQVQYDACPRFDYLAVSLCLGNGLTGWFFQDN